MNFDYGKIAYLKIVELEKQLSKLQETITIQNNSSMYFISENDNNNTAVYEKTFVFNSKNSGKYSIDGIINAEIETGTLLFIDIYLDDCFMDTRVIGMNDDLEYSLNLLIKKGKNSLIFKFRSDTVFNVKKITANIHKSENSNTFNRITKIPKENGDYVLIVKDKYANLQIIDNGEREAITISKFTLKDGIILYHDSDYIYVSYISSNYELFLRKINKETYEYTDENLKVNGVNSVAGYYKDGNLVIIFVKFNQVHIGKYNFSTFTYENVGQIANRVYTEPSISDLYIITNSQDKTKLIF